MWPFGSRAEKPVEQKASAVGSLVVATVMGRPVWAKRDFQQAAREGYQQNPIVYACIRKVAQAVASLPLDIVNRQGQSDGEEVENPELAQLLNRPNPLMDGETFREWLVSTYLLGGNAYVERVDIGGRPVELWLWRPDRVQVIPGPDGLPQAYRFRASGGERTVAVDFKLGGRQPVLHWRDYSPNDDWYGMPTVDPASFAIDSYTAAEAWNKALLDNGARPSGALVFNPKEGNATLGDEQFNRLKTQLEQGYAGAANSGKPMILDGGLTFQEMSLSPKDMDFGKGKDSAARTIALTFGVPPLLLGIPGDSTFNNITEANKAFYRETVIPLAKKMCRALSNWVGPAFGPGIEIEPDTDDLYVFADERSAKVKQIEDSAVLSVNEKRAEAWSMDPVDGGDEILVPSSMIPLDDAGASITSPDPSADPNADPEADPNADPGEDEE